MVHPILTILASFQMGGFPLTTMNLQFQGPCLHWPLQGPGGNIVCVHLGICFCKCGRSKIFNCNPLRSVSLSTTTLPLSGYVGGGKGRPKDPGKAE